MNIRADALTIGQRIERGGRVHTITDVEVLEPMEAGEPEARRPINVPTSVRVHTDLCRGPDEWYSFAPTALVTVTG